jgi:ZIP family zinc transporter
MLVAIGVDLAVDGVLLGIGFAAGAKEGRMLAFALATELVALALALATVATLQRRGASRGRALRILGGLLGVFVASAVAGTLLLAHLSGHALVFVLAFGSAALLFLVTEELLVEAHEEKETAWMTATFFAGFLLFLVIGVIG